MVSTNQITDVTVTNNNGIIVLKTRTGTVIENSGIELIELPLFAPISLNHFSKYNVSANMGKFKAEGLTFLKVAGSKVEFGKNTGQPNN